MAAMRWRHELDKWIKDEQKNIYEMKITGQKGRAMELSILDLVKFSIELNSDANVVTVTSTEEDLQGFWLQKMTEYIQGNPKNTLASFLDTATSVYTDKDPQDSVTPASDLDDNKFKSQEDMFDGEETPFTATPVGFEFDLPLEPPSAQVAKAKQQEMVKNHLVEQVQNTINSLNIGDTIKQMQGAAQKDWSTKADRIMYVRFFTDGIFTIDNGPARLMSDPKEKQLLEAFGKGFVPPEYSQNAKDIDLHVIWENYKHHEFEDVQKQKAQMDKMQVDDFDDEIMEQIKQQSLLEELSRQEREKAEAATKAKPVPAFTGQGNALGTNAPKPAINVAKPVETKPTPAPVVQKPIVPAATASFKYAPIMSQPHTTIQFKFEDGTKLVQIFNLSDAVEILYKFIAASNKVPGNFKLVNISKPLTDKQSDLKSQGLQNASILVKKE